MNKIICVKCGKPLEKYETCCIESTLIEIQYQCIDCMIQEKQVIINRGYEDYFKRINL